MASPEVCSAFPTITWSISSGATPERASASFAATTARSRSLKWPLYSAIGVRAPSTMYMSFIESPVVLLTFLQQNRNPDDLNRHHPHAAFDAERAAGDPRRPGRARRHHGQ